MPAPTGPGDDDPRLRLQALTVGRPTGRGIIVALVKCWAVLRAPAGKRLAPMLAVLVPLLRRDGSSTSTMPRGRCHTKPGSLLKSQIPIRTWADWDDAVPGSWRSTWVAHEGDPAPELAKLNEIWALDAVFTNYFL